MVQTYKILICIIKQYKTQKYFELLIFQIDNF